MSATADVSADAGVCIGAGNCAVVAPRVFDLDDDSGTVTVLRRQVAGEDVDDAEAAADACPAFAILVDRLPG